MPATNVTALQRRLQDWTSQPAHERNYMRGPLQTLEQDLEDPRARIRLSIAGGLLGTWHMAHGQAAVLGGDTTWDEARLGSSLQRLALLLRCHRARGHGHREQTPDLPVQKAAHCIATGLALGDPHGEALCELFAELRDSAFGAEDAWPLFVRELLRVRAGRRPTITHNLGVYAEILQGWQTDLALFARRLAGLLDHHLDGTQKGGAFDEPCMWLLPAEILAIRAVRHELELPWPKVEHPLMFTNLATTVPGGPWPQDALLRRLQRLVDA